jgi:hypothetical protein
MGPTHCAKPSCCTSVTYTLHYDITILQLVWNANAWNGLNSDVQPLDKWNRELGARVGVLPEVCGQLHHVGEPCKARQRQQCMAAQFLPCVHAAKDGECAGGAPDTSAAL